MLTEVEIGQNEGLAEAINLWLQQTQERAEEEREESGYSVSIPEDSHKRLKTAAAKSGFSEAEILRRAIDIALTELEQVESLTDDPRGGEISTSPQRREFHEVRTTDYAEITDKQSQIKTLIAMADEILSSQHPVAGVALAANIVSFHLLLGRGHITNALEPATPANHRSLEQIRESVERIRGYVSRLITEREGSGRTVPTEP